MNILEAYKVLFKNLQSLGKYCQKTLGDIFFSYALYTVMDLCVFNCSILLKYVQPSRRFANKTGENT